MKEENIRSISVTQIRISQQCTLSAVFAVQQRVLSPLRLMLTALTPHRNSTWFCKCNDSCQILINDIPVSKFWTETYLMKLRGAKKYWYNRYNELHREVHLRTIWFQHDGGGINDSGARSASAERRCAVVCTFTGFIRICFLWEYLIVSVHHSIAGLKQRIRKISRRSQKK